MIDLVWALAFFPGQRTRRMPETPRAEGKRGVLHFVPGTEPSSVGESRLENVLHLPPTHPPTHLPSAFVADVQLLLGSAMVLFTERRLEPIEICFADFELDGEMLEW